MLRHFVAISLIAAMVTVVGTALTTAEERQSTPRGPSAADYSAITLPNHVLVTRNYPLKHIAARDAAPKIDATLEKVRSYDATNSLIIRATQEDHERISKQINRLDVPPTQIYIKCLITRISADGEREVLSRPIVRTLDGQNAIIQIGGDPTWGLEISLTPSIVRSEAESLKPVEKPSRK